ncbi:MAG: cell wall-active antibiotics response protein [bacterium]|jgi:predicted membrane protein
MQRRESVGLILILLGGVLLSLSIITNIYPHVRIWKIMPLLWPLVLVALGLYLIFRKQFQAHPKVIEISAAAEKIATEFGQKFEKTFGDVSLNARDAEIDGTNVSCAFGDCFLNLTGAKLKPGTNQIFVATTFGDVTIMVPKNIEVWVFGTSTMGDLVIFDRKVSGISNSLSHQTPGYDTAAVRLQITARTTFGDVQVLWG